MKKFVLPFFPLFIAATAHAAGRPYDPGLSLERSHTHIDLHADGTSVETTDTIWRVDGVQAVEISGTDRVYYISSMDEVESVEAWSIAPDGTQLRVSEDRIRTQDETSEEGDAEFSDLKSKVVIYPSVQVGSRHRYVSRVRHHMTIFPGYFGESFRPGTATRVDDWELTLDAPAGMKLALDVVGIEGGFVASANGVDHYRFHYTNPTPLAPEEGGIAESGASAHVSLSTFADPVALGAAYQAASRPMATVTPAIRERARSLTRGLKSDAEKVRALHHWVARNIRYVFVGLGTGRWVPHKADEVLERLYGDCKDHAILLEALLAAVDIPSSAALVNLGNVYELSRVGASGAINHVITYVPSLDLYIDSTNSFATHGSLGYSVMDKPTILTALNRIGHTPPMRADQNTVSSQQEITVQPDGNLVGRSSMQATGTSEQYSRANRFNATGEDETKVVKDLLSRFNESGIGRIDHADPEALGEPFWVKSEFTLEPLSNFPGPGAMPVPVGLSPGYLAGFITDPPPAVRRLEWQCSSRTVEETTVLHFPATVEISFVPQGTDFEEEGFRYVSRYERKGRDITVHRRFVEQHPGNVCGKPEHEARLRFLSALRRDLRGQVIYR